ncbi:hypothetical protein C2L65_31550 [Paraburkholderia terrae]|uniref:Uncharacterized protein n=1 Tax=Paraburkholderia terrae TaxID=311230 RepID=A0A2I8EXN5_9BURK|nr:hypothetical protein C2L65_31550 [Paraburkholderia terrae]
MEMFSKGNIALSPEMATGRIVMTRETQTSMESLIARGSRQRSIFPHFSAQKMEKQELQFEMVICYGTSPKIQMMENFTHPNDAVLDRH